MTHHCPFLLIHFPQGDENGSKPATKRATYAELESIQCDLSAFSGVKFFRIEVGGWYRNQGCRPLHCLWRVVRAVIRMSLQFRPRAGGYTWGCYVTAARSKRRIRTELSQVGPFGAPAVFAPSTSSPDAS